ncbi:MAG: transglycosylase SLT domain-containing protein [Campylobacterales bacterium]|nr:transglycosylase SLT domain-containing protein [Campylobacterales bacterium]
MKYLALLITTIILTGCVTSKHQHTRDYGSDRYTLYPSYPNYNRNYVSPRFSKGKDGIYLNHVKKYSNKYYISESLILAIMETESNFNKNAKSYIPAIGLMQIVPKTAGKDVLGFTPSHSYLYNPDNNIHVGTKYLNKIYYKYFKNIKDPKSKEYLTIAAYNTGIGNVLRTFSKNRKYAAKIINSKSSNQIYKFIIKNLPHKETRDYLKKVTARKGKYSKYDS